MFCSTRISPVAFPTVRVQMVSSELLWIHAMHLIQTLPSEQACMLFRDLMKLVYDYTPDRCPTCKHESVLYEVD